MATHCPECPTLLDDIGSLVEQQDRTGSSPSCLVQWVGPTLGSHVASGSTSQSSSS